MLYLQSEGCLRGFLQFLLASVFRTPPSIPNPPPRSAGAEQLEGFISSTTLLVTLGALLQRLRVGRAAGLQRTQFLEGVHDL